MRREYHPTHDWRVAGQAFGGLTAAVLCVIGMGLAAGPNEQWLCYIGLASLGASVWAIWATPVNRCRYPICRQLLICEAHATEFSCVCCQQVWFTRVRGRLG